MTDNIRPIMIYLAGPIDSVTGREALEWRSRLGHEAPSGVTFFSPAHAYKGVTKISAQAVDHTNKHVIAVCDGVLVNMEFGLTFGTVREVEFARQLGKPVAIAEYTQNLGDSLMSWDIALAPTLDLALVALLDDIRENRQIPSWIQLPVLRLDTRQEEDPDD